MNNDTYEFERSGQSKLEKYEWDNLWTENANDDSRKRILLIGDSITNGFRPVFNNLLSNSEYYADQLATSKSVDNEHLIKLIDYVLEQNSNYDKINFMFGGHGWHLTHEEYYSYYEQIIQYVKSKCPNAKITISNFTPIADKNNLNCLSEKNNYIIERNKKAKLLAENNLIEFIDVYEAIINVDDKKMIYTNDGVHFVEEGYKIIANLFFDALV